MHSPGKKSIFSFFLFAKIDGCLKNRFTTPGLCQILFGHFFLNVLCSRINKVKKTEFIFRSLLDLFFSSKIEFDFFT